MGASASVDLRPEDVSEVQDLTNYEPKEIKSLYKRFRRLDRTGRGTISTDDLTMIPQIAMNPFAARLTALFERDFEDRINFKSFVCALSIFSPHAREEVKARAVFKLYDVDGDGFVGPEDLKKVLEMMISSGTVSADAADQLVAKTLRQADMDGDGKISFEDFSQCTVAFDWSELDTPVKSSMRRAVEFQRESESSGAGLDKLGGGGGGH